MEVIDNTFSYEVLEDYIHFTLKGERSYENMVRWWIDIAEVSKKLSFDKILVEAIITGDFSHNEMFDLVSEFEHWGFKEFKVAYIEKNLDHEMINKYGQLIAKISGINGEVFTNKDEALKWLISS